MPDAAIQKFKGGLPRSLRSLAMTGEGVLNRQGVKGAKKLKHGADGGSFVIALAKNKNDLASPAEAGVLKGCF